MTEPRATDADLFVLGSGPQAGGAGLRSALEAHLRYEHAQGVRLLVGRLLVWLSVPLWLAAARPAWTAADLRRLLLAAWAVCFAGLVAAAAVERRWRRRCFALVAPSAVDDPRAAGCAGRRTDAS